MGCGVFLSAACCPRAQNNRTKPHAICKKSFPHIPWCFLTLQNKRGVCRKLDIQHEDLTNHACFSEACGRACWSLTCSGMLQCDWGAPAYKCNLGCSKGLAPAIFSPSAWPFHECFPNISLKTELFPLETSEKSPRALLFSYLASHFFMPLFLLSAASPVLPALPPLTLLSLSAGKTLLNEADKDS